MSISSHEATTETVILILILLLVCLVVATLCIVWRILKTVIRVSKGERWSGKGYSTVSFKISRQGSERSTSTQGQGSSESGIDPSMRTVECRPGVGHHHRRKDVTSLAGHMAGQKSAVQRSIRFWPKQNGGIEKMSFSDITPSMY